MKTDEIKKEIMEEFDRRFYDGDWDRFSRQDPHVIKDFLSSSLDRILSVQREEMKDMLSGVKRTADKLYRVKKIDAEFRLLFHKVIGKYKQFLSPNKEDESKYDFKFAKMGNLILEYNPKENELTVNLDHFKSPSPNEGEEKGNKP